MCDEEVLNKVFMGKPEGRRKAERPELRWLDCMEKWSQSMGVKKWRKKSEDICMGCHSDRGTGYTLKDRVPRKKKMAPLSALTKQVT
jgi:hypothetical protein